MIDHFDIKQEETLVIGDSDNDRAMFEFGGYTVSMKNARPEIQSITDVHNIQMKRMARFIFRTTFLIKGKKVGETCFTFVLNMIYLSLFKFFDDLSLL